jgi:hypothetical protein
MERSCNGMVIMNTNFDAKGITAISQWLSVATPLDSYTSKLMPKASQQVDGG